MSRRRKRKSDKKTSRGEEMCREAAQDLTGQLFPSVRPDWLMNPESGKPLELDCYCENLEIAIEYDGIQHYEYTRKFHRRKADFEDQVKRDKLKVELCKAHGTDLIVIDGTAGRNTSDMQSEVRLAIMEILWRRDALSDRRAAGSYPEILYENELQPLVVVSIYLSERRRYWISVNFDPESMEYNIYMPLINSSMRHKGSRGTASHIYDYLDKMLTDSFQIQRMRMKLLMPERISDDDILWEIKRDKEEFISGFAAELPRTGFAFRWLQNAILALHRMSVS